MRIAVYHNIPTGGAKRVVYEHCRGLVSAGHEVVIYETTSAQSDFCEMNRLGCRLVRRAFQWRPTRAHLGLTKLAGTVHNTLILRNNYLRLARLGQEVAAEIDNEAFDLLYVHHDVYEIAPSVLRFAGTPSVYFCQEPTRTLFEAPIVEQSLSTPTSAHALWRHAAGINLLTDYVDRFRILNERTNTLAANWVLCNSAYSAESLLRAHGRTGRVCRLGVDIAFFSPGASAASSGLPYVLSVGALHPLKGFRFLIRSLARLPQNARPELVLVGDRAHSEEPPRLQALAEQHQVRLRILHQVTDEELRELYRGARIFVYAPYLEPFGLAALEAMACGTPVLGVREGGLRETVRDGVTGRLVERDVGLFAAALTEMLSDPARLEQMGQQAREHVCRNWTWEQSVRCLLKLFEEFRGTKQPPADRG